MTICSTCGNPLEDSVRFCSACGDPAPGWKSKGSTKPIMEETTRPSSGLLGADKPDASSLTKEEEPARPAATGLLGKDPMFPRKAMSWLKSHRKAATLLSLASLAFTLLGQWAVGDWWKARQRPQPVAIWIEGARAEVPAGTKLRLTAKTSPANHLPDKFIWSPADMIEGNGQSSVILDTKSNDRHTEYLIEVGLEAFDNLGYPSPKVAPVIIKIVPQAQLNSKPEWQDHIQMEGSPEVRAGSTVRLEALAADKDGDKLTYSWSIESKSVEVEGNGTRKVLLKLPREFAKRSNVTSIVKLNVSDGFPDHDISDFVYLTVTPSGRPIISRKSAKQAVPASGSQAQPQEAPADKPTAAVPLASPTSSQSPNKPN